MSKKVRRKLLEYFVLEVTAHSANLLDISPNSVALFFRKIRRSISWHFALDANEVYDVLDVSEFHHLRINHRVRFAKEKNPINSIENFWSQAKRVLRK